MTENRNGIAAIAAAGAEAMVRRVNESCLQNAMHEADEQRERAEKADADTRRLDWLEARAERQHDKETGERFYEISDAKELSGWSMTLRAAIDAAMAGTD